MPGIQFVHDVGTTSGISKTLAAATGVIHRVTSISGHSNADCLIQIKNGTTVEWEEALDVSAEGFKFGDMDPNGLMESTAGNALIFKISAAAGDCALNATVKSFREDERSMVDGN